MGWFWVDSPRSINKPLHPVRTSNATPPPGCPMHAGPPTNPASLPNKPPPTPSQRSCPVGARDAPPSSTDTPRHRLNPLNYIPSNLSQSRAKRQTVNLPTEREMSSIPRGDADSNWEYPSPQQMYNAMLRKGYDDTPEDAVETMVAVHNFLNEGAWVEIVDWERRFSRGLSHGWRACIRGEEAFRENANELARAEDIVPPRLLRFQGRPNDVTPKAKIMDILRTVYPARFGGELPFDRHDWLVQRRTVEGLTKEVRYVIDYYSGAPEPTGEPVFYLDVRPAVDTPSAAAERLIRWGGDIWYRGTGAAVREKG
ncbi:MAG: hypothetical protein LQ342_006227 [Letrouitia transgressa]|nr:MAG: hypothetical protein LQ342_006227 [Letrouitia transgressa]